MKAAHSAVFAFPQQPSRIETKRSQPTPQWGGSLQADVIVTGVRHPRPPRTITPQLESVGSALVPFPVLFYSVHLISCRNVLGGYRSRGMDYCR